VDAGVSPRHLSFIETGRSRPSREMVLRLADQLRLPLRDRNVLLLAAGFAPAFAQGDLEAPELAAVRRAAALQDHTIVMHPGPMNRGVEIAPEVADGPRSTIVQQVANGVTVRTAVLYLLLGSAEPAIGAA